MDTRVKWYEDPVYIKMCDCPEMQGQRQYHRGDYFSTDYDAEYGITILDMDFDEDAAHIGFFEETNPVWLPRQDQLQEIYCDGRGGKHFPLEGLVKGFVDFAFCGRWQPPYDISLKTLDLSPFTSMEQLWLAFYMKEKHNKVWNGDKWAEKL